MEKKKLTSKQINAIFEKLVFCKLLPEEVADSRKERIILSLQEQLSNITIYEHLIPQLTDEIEKKFYKALSDPGEMVGILSSTYVAEIITQLTLSSFHFAGLSSFSISLGVPRIEEVFNATKNIKQPSMTLYFNLDRLGGIQTMDSKQNETTKSNIDFNYIYKVCDNKIKELTLFEFITREPEICYSRILDNSEKLIYNMFFQLESDSVKENEFDWSIRLYLNLDMMYKTRITTREIAKKIESFRDLYCVFFPDSYTENIDGILFNIIDVYIDTSKIIVPQVRSKDYPELPIRPDLNEDNINYYYIKSVVIPYLMDIQVSGISDILKIHYRKDIGADSNIWIADTEGSNLRDVFQIEEIDFKRTLTNDIYEIYQTLGIEATRNAIIIELCKIVSSGLLRCHPEIIADAQTFSGKFTSINRYGIDKVQTGPLSKMSFELTFNHIFDCAMKGEIDMCDEVSSNVILGRTGNFGTGYFGLIYPKVKIQPEKFKEKSNDLMACLDKSFKKELSKVEFNPDFEENFEENVESGENIPQYIPVTESTSDIISRIKEKDKNIPYRSPARSSTRSNISVSSSVCSSPKSEGKMIVLGDDIDSKPFEKKPILKQEVKEKNNKYDKKKHGNFSKRSEYKF